MFYTKPLILLIEDNQDDLYFIQRAFKVADVSCEIAFCQGGQQAINYFEEGNPLPQLILLDFKMPKKSGLDVLRYIRQHPELSGLVVIAFTASFDQRDVREAYKLHVNAFVAKPSSLEKIVEFARTIDTFWLQEETFVRPICLRTAHMALA